MKFKKTSWFTMIIGSLTIAMCIAWVGSYWWTVTWFATDWYTLSLWSGNIEFVCSDTGIPKEWVVRGPGMRESTKPGCPPFIWNLDPANTDEWCIRASTGTFSLILIGLCLFLAYASYQAMWRRKSNACQKCDYSLIGLKHYSICPECGTTAFRQSGRNRQHQSSCGMPPET